MFQDVPAPGHARAERAQRNRPTAPTGERVSPHDLGGMFDRYADELMRYCSRRVGPDHAEDVVAETFLTAHAQAHRFDQNRAGVLPWLYGIATNLLRRHRRAEVHGYRALARMYASAVPPGDDAVAQRAAERVDAQHVRVRLARALASLPRRQRDVLLLFAVAELGYAEIAAALDLPLGTVQSTLHRARARVRAALGGNPTTGGDQ